MFLIFTKTYIKIKLLFKTIIFLFANPLSIKKNNNFFETKSFITSQIHIKKINNKLEVAKHSDNNEFNKSEYVWQMWFQGLDKRPEIVKRCMNSVVKEMGSSKTRILTKENIDSYIEIPGFIYDRVKSGQMRMCHFSDIVRSKVMAKYGGFWIDATVLLTDDPNYLIQNTNFFTFKITPSLLAGNDMRWFATWFIYSKYPSKLFELTSLALTDYWKKNTQIEHYFKFNHYLTNINNIFFNGSYGFSDSDIPLYDIDPSLMLLNWHKPYSKELIMKIKRRTPVHKLSYTLEFPYKVKKDSCFTIQDWILLNQ